MKHFIFLVLLFAAAAHGSDVAGLDPKTALKLLVQGNQRYLTEQAEQPKIGAERRVAVAHGQRPYAVIVGCSDSRVPAEIVFDEGIGYLFVVRTAGNVVSTYEIASIEYAVEHLGSRLVVVLGHEKCGAVDAAVKGVHEDSHLPDLLEEIEPAVKSARKMKGDLLKNSIRQNVLRVVEQIKTSEPVLEKALEEGKIRVVGAVYDLKTGRVTFLD